MRTYKDCGTITKGITYIYLIGLPEGEKRENRAEEIFEVMMAENFSKLMIDNKSQICLTQRHPEG